MSEGAPNSEVKAKGNGRQFSEFVLVGGFAAAVNWLSRILFSQLGMSLTLAIVCAYVLGMATAYLLSRRFVFEKSGRTPADEIARFGFVNVIALFQVWGVTILLERYGLPAIGWEWRNEAIAHAVGVASPVFTSFVGHRYFTFGKVKTDR